MSESDHARCEGCQKVFAADHMQHCDDCGVLLCKRCHQRNPRCAFCQDEANGKVLDGKVS